MRDVVTLGALLVFVVVKMFACAGPAQQQPQQPIPHAHEQVVEFGVVAVEPGPPGAHDAPPHAHPGVPAPLVKDQPPHIKLRLGHYHNAARGIGVTIDLTEKTDNYADIDPAKVRFDGDSKVYRLEGRQSRRDRIDYVRDGKHVMLQVWSDGRMAVSVPDPDEYEPSSDLIFVTRDGDAEPL